MNSKAFVDGLIDNDEKVAPSKKQTQFTTTALNLLPTLFKTKMAKGNTLYMFPKQLKKTPPFGAAHTYIAHNYKGEAPGLKSTCSPTRGFIVRAIVPYKLTSCEQNFASLFSPSSGKFFLLTKKLGSNGFTCLGKLVVFC